jgi:hypothetical protein
MFHQETTAQHGGNHASKNDIIITSKPEQGTSRAYTLSRLKSERRDLFERYPPPSGYLAAGADRSAHGKPEEGRITQPFRK